MGGCLVYPAGAPRDPDGHQLYPRLPTPSLPVPVGMMSRASWGCRVHLLCRPLSQLGFSPTVTRDPRRSTYQRASQRGCENAAIQLLQTARSLHRTYLSANRFCLKKKKKSRAVIVKAAPETPRNEKKKKKEG